MKMISAILLLVMSSPLFALTCQDSSGRGFSAEFSADGRVASVHNVGGYQIAELFCGFADTLKWMCRGSGNDGMPGRFRLVITGERMKDGRQSAVLYLAPDGYGELPLTYLGCEP